MIDKRKIKNNDTPSSEDMEIVEISGPDRILVTRQIHIFGEIEDKHYTAFYGNYTKLIEEDPLAPIHVILDTPGGDLFAALGIINLIQLSTTPIYTYTLSRAFSAGAWIFLAGSRRFIPQTNLCSLLLHPFSWANEGNTQDHGAYYGMLQKIQTSLLSLLTEQKVALPKRELQDISTAVDRYFVGSEIIKYGLATEYLTANDYYTLCTAPAIARKERKVYS